MTLIDSRPSLPSLPSLRQCFFAPALVLCALASLAACQITPQAASVADDEAGTELRAALEQLTLSCEADARELESLRADVTERLVVQSDRLERVGTTLDQVASRMDTLGAQPAKEESSAPVCAKVEPARPQKLVVGRREKVWIEALDMMLAARIDTGAETASLDARNIEEFERNGEAWVRFDIVDPESGEAIAIEREVARFVRIIQSSTDATERRPVIELGIIIGSVRQEAEFTLSNRSHMDFQVLVGRNILRDLMVVDVGQSNIAPPQVPKKTGEASANES